MYLDIQNGNGDQNPDSGSLVIAYTKDPGEAANQLWKFSNGYIQSRAPNALVLDIQDSSTDPNGATVTAQTKNGSANPCWTLVPASQIA
jgi:hypothetical protein